MKITSLSDKKKEKELEHHNTIVEYLQDTLDALTKEDASKAETLLVIVRTEDDQYMTTSYVPHKNLIELVGFLESVKMTCCDIMMEDDD